MKPNRPLRIVVADDEPDMLFFLRELLPHLGHEAVAAAASGHDLIERCRGNQISNNGTNGSEIRPPTAERTVPRLRTPQPEATPTATTATETTQANPLS